MKRKGARYSTATGGTVVAVSLAVVASVAVCFFLPMSGIVLLPLARMMMFLGEVFEPLGVMGSWWMRLVVVGEDSHHVWMLGSTPGHSFLDYLGAVVPLGVALIWVRRQRLWVKRVMQSQVAMFRAVHSTPGVSESEVQQAARRYLAVRCGAEDGGAAPEYATP